MGGSDNNQWLLHLLIGLVSAIACSLVLRFSYIYFAERRCGVSDGAKKLISVSKGVLEKDVAEAWLAMFPLHVADFLARALWLEFSIWKEECRPATRIYDTVRQDVRWRHGGLAAMLELVICDMFRQDETQAFLMCMDAITFLRLDEEVPRESVNSLFLHVLSNEQSNKVDRTTFPLSSATLSTRIQKHFCLLGILEKQDSSYRLTSSIPHEVRPTENGTWHLFFIDHLQQSIFSPRDDSSCCRICALTYLPRLLIEKGRQYSKAMEMLLDEKFIQLRLEILGAMKGTRLHIDDSSQLVEWSRGGLAEKALSKSFAEQLCLKVAKFVTSGRALFELGQFLLTQAHSSNNVTGLFLSSLAQQEEECKDCLKYVADSFLNLATQYLCYEKEEIYFEYLTVSRQFAKELSLQNLMQVCHVHAKYEDQQKHAELHKETNTKGFSFRVQRVQFRLRQFVSEHLTSMSQTYESLCNFPVDKEAMQNAYLVLKTMEVINSIPERSQIEVEKPWFRRLWGINTVAGEPQQNGDLESENRPLLERA